MVKKPWHFCYIQKRREGIKTIKQLCEIQHCMDHFVRVGGRGMVLRVQQKDHWLHYCNCIIAISIAGLYLRQLWFCLGQLVDWMKSLDVDVTEANFCLLIKEGWVGKVWV